MGREEPGVFAARHFLVIERLSEDPSDWEWHVEHPESCGWDAPEDDPLRSHVCAVGAEISHVGLDSLDDWQSLNPGRYEIAHWSRKYDTEYGPEWDGGLEIRDRAANSHSEPAA